ncbi:MAG TPA: GNAT family N-acetyltransferase [Acidimicrobiales bacterium]|nr:GNAT family N-acetyltransferase [Acidimicrobiales bacterium]
MAEWDVITVRPRGDGDLAGCVSLLRAVHEIDGYPSYLPESPATFLTVPDALGAWVALADDQADHQADHQADDQLVGHVLLRPATSPAVMTAAAEASGRPPERLAVVGRLLVAPAARRRGAGARLLSHAALQSWKLGRRPILDVVVDHVAAIALYEREGWERVGPVEVHFADGQTFRELVFLGPDEVHA